MGLTVPGPVIVYKDQLTVTKLKGSVPTTSVTEDGLAYQLVKHVRSVFLHLLHQTDEQNVLI